MTNVTQHPAVGHNRIKQIGKEIEQHSAKADASREEWAKEMVEIAVLVAEARTLIPPNREFGHWFADLETNFNKNDRAALVKIGANRAAAEVLFTETSRYSVKMMDESGEIDDVLSRFPRAGKTEPMIPEPAETPENDAQAEETPEPETPKPERREIPTKDPIIVKKFGKDGWILWEYLKKVATDKEAYKAGRSLKLIQGLKKAGTSVRTFAEMIQSGDYGHTGSPEAQKFWPRMIWPEMNVKFATSRTHHSEVTLAAFKQLIAIMPDLKRMVEEVDDISDYQTCYQWWNENVEGKAVGIQDPVVSPMNVLPVYPDAPAHMGPACDQDIVVNGIIIHTAGVEDFAVYKRKWLAAQVWLFFDLTDHQREPCVESRGRRYIELSKFMAAVCPVGGKTIHRIGAAMVNTKGTGKVEFSIAPKISNSNG